MLDAAKGRRVGVRQQQRPTTRRLTVLVLRGAEASGPLLLPATLVDALGQVVAYACRDDESLDAASVAHVRAQVHALMLMLVLCCARAGACMWASMLS